MAYTPTPPSTLIPGYAGNGTYYGVVLGNVDEAYAYGPNIIAQATKWATLSTSYVTMGEWVVPRNADQQPLVVSIWWRGTTGYTAAALLELDDGVTTESVSVNNTASAYSHSTLTLTPSATSGHPRWARIRLKTSNALQQAAIATMSCHYAPGAIGTGVLASGAIACGAWDFADGAVPSEVIARGANTIRAIARDRGAGIAGGMNHNDTGVAPSPAGPDYDVTGSDWTTVDRFVVPYHDPARRLYRLAVKASGTDPAWRLQVGPYTWSGSGAGWSYDLPELAIPEGAVGTLSLRSTSAGSCAIDTWQILREAP